MRKRKVIHRKQSLLSRIIKIIIAVVLLAVLFDGYLFFSSGILKVKNINVTMQNVGCTNELQIKSASGLLDQNILLLNLSSAKDKIKSFLCIRSVNLSKQLPNTINIEVSGRQAVAELVNISGQDGRPLDGTESAVLSSEILATKSGEIASSSGFAVDAEGVIFAKDVNLNIPKIYYHGSGLMVGRNLEEDLVVNSLKILDGVKKLGIEPKDAKIYSSALLVETLGSPKLIFALKNDLNIQLASLQLILQEAKINNRTMEFVDLRYDKPVVKYVKGDK